MAESVFKRKFHARLYRAFPGCLILKNDAEFLPGILDTLILFGPRWAALEFKDSAKSSFQPNQRYYIAQMNDMSYAAVVYPENQEEVFRDLQRALQPRR